MQCDEVYLDCRYISAAESCWRIYEFELQKHFSSVERLQYHLLAEQFVVFNDHEDIQKLLDHRDLKDTKFTKWFDANKRNAEARELIYVEFPSKWVWNREIKVWTYRIQRPSIGRLTYAHPNSGERYFLRMLLNIVRGATSYEDIRTVNGIVHPSFKAVCLARGLLADDSEWNEALTEASTSASARQLRDMFCSILLFCEVTNPKELFKNYWKDLTDDFLYRMGMEMRNIDVHVLDCEQKKWGLLEIEHILNKIGRSLREFPPMPLPSSESDSFSMNRLIVEVLDYDTASVL